MSGSGARAYMTLARNRELAANAAAQDLRGPHPGMSWDGGQLDHFIENGTSVRTAVSAEYGPSTALVEPREIMGANPYRAPMIGATIRDSRMVRAVDKAGSTACREPASPSPPPTDGRLPVPPLTDLQTRKLKYYRLRGRRRYELRSVIGAVNVFYVIERTKRIPHPIWTEADLDRHHEKVNEAMRIWK